MADVKISELTAQASASVDVSADVLALVDTSVPQTKKISVENLLSPITIDKSAGTITSLGTVTGNVDFDGDLDVDGTTNLDNTDIDGTLTVDGARSGDFLTKLTSTNQYGLYIKTTGTTTSHDLLRLDDNSGTAFSVMATGATGIGTGSPDSLIHAKVTTDTSETIRIQNDDTLTTIGVSSDGYTFHTYQHSLYLASWDGSTWSTKARWDSDGKLLIGGTTSRALSGVNSQLQVEGTTYNTSSVNLIGNTGTDAATCPILFFGRSRGTAVGSSTVVADGDRLGALFFCGADDTDIQTVAASIDVEVDGTPGGNDMPGRIIFKTNSGSSAATARWNMVAAGNILPEADNAYNLGSSARQVSAIFTANAVTVSDETKKENIKDCDLGIDFVNTLKPKSYNIKNLEETHDDYNRKHYGLIAQDLKDGKLKDSVFGDKDGEYGLNYNDLIAPLIKAVQELSAKVEALENA